MYTEHPGDSNFKCASTSCGVDPGKPWDILHALMYSYAFLISARTGLGKARKRRQTPSPLVHAQTH